MIDQIFLTDTLFLTVFAVHWKR